MDFEKRFAEVILEAVKIREESFDQAMADEMEKSKHPNFHDCYRLSIWEAVEKAVEQLDIDKRMVQPIYLLIQYTWNDIQDWAEKIKAD